MPGHALISTSHTPASRPVGAGVVALCVIATCLAVTAGLAAGATIYKCTGPGGQISFEDRPCEAGSREEALPTRRLPTTGSTAHAGGETAAGTAGSETAPATATSEIGAATERGGGAPVAANGETGPATQAPAGGTGVVSGTIYGERFSFSKGRVYKLGAYVLELKQGEALKPEKAITVFLWGSQGAPLGGRSFSAPDPSQKQQPQIIMIWTTSAGERRQEELTAGYTMQLSFDQPAEKTIDGTIALALPDKSALDISGKFTVELDY